MGRADSGKLIADELSMVEDVLRDAVASDVRLLSEASDFILSSGGKRIRPRITLLSHKAAGGGDPSQAVRLAAAVELLHTASLIHDDINDRSDMRRGTASVNAQWGNGLALLIGDFVFVKLLGLAASFDSKVFRVLADSCSDIVEGETLGMLHRGDTGMTEETYLSIVTRLTASLFAASGELGALVAEATAEQVEALREYGLNLGIAFQIRDDTLDLVGETDTLGKPVTSDLERGKMSLATLYALNCVNETGEDILSWEPARVDRLLLDTGAIEYAMSKAREYSVRAKRPLSILPESEAKAALSELAEFASARGQ
jgi:octaprenyl-diphosphate synthase